MKWLGLFALHSVELSRGFSLSLSWLSKKYGGVCLSRWFSLVKGRGCGAQTIRKIRGAYSFYDEKSS